MRRRRRLSPGEMHLAAALVLIVFYLANMGLTTWGGTCIRPTLPQLRRSLIRRPSKSRPGGDGQLILTAATR